MSISKKQANELWGSLRSNLLAAQDNIRQIIATKAWEPLGYDTFTEAWADRLADLKLYGELRAVVVYEMFNDGSTTNDVCAAMAGVGPTTAKNLKLAHDKGLDPAAAHTISKSADRHRPGSDKDKPKTVFVRLNADDHAALTRLAADQDATVSDTARDIILEGLRKWTA